MAETSLPHNHSTAQNPSHLYTEFLDVGNFETVAEIFKMLGDSTRVRIFWLLSHSEECVVNLSALMNMSSPALSHHLKALNDCGLITSRRDGKEVYYKAAETEVCSLLHKTVEKIMEITCPQKAVDTHATPEDIVHIVHEHLLDHLDVRTTIENLSKEYLINPTTLKQTFKKVYGSSIAAHMNEHRMEQAAKLLVTTNKSIAEISKTVGYESQSRFTTVFKNTFNLSPTEFRRDKNINDVKEIIETF